MASRLTWWEPLKSVIDTENPVIFRECQFEFCTFDSASHSLDLTSAILPQRSRIWDDSGEHAEFIFSQFLSSDVTKHPFILVSMQGSPAGNHDNEQKQSTPTTFQNHPSDLSFKPKTETKTTSKDGSQGSASGLWGSPMKCDIPLEDSLGVLSLDSSYGNEVKPRSLRKPSRLGLPLSTTRKILSAFNVGSGTECNTPPLIVLCDGRNFKRTALMGVMPFSVPRSNRIAKGLKTITVTYDESGNVEDWNSKIAMDGMQTQSCCAVYEVSPSPTGVPQENFWGSVAVEIKWKGATRLLDAPPMDANTCIKASVTSGHFQSKLNSHYKELEFLSTLVNALSTGEAEGWPGGEPRSPHRSFTASITAFVQALQEEGSLQSAEAARQREEEKGQGVKGQNLMRVSERSDYDFTDRLWKEMLGCASYQDLVSGLRLVLTALKQGQLRPFVARHNHTTLAQMVREAFTGRFSMPSLTGLQALQFLAEAGAEKLHRDYLHFFVSQSLAAPSSLAAADQDPAAKLEGLSKLHHTAEMVALLDYSLNLFMDTLGAVARQMLARYDLNALDPRHTFSFSVKTSDVRGALASGDLVMWCLEGSAAVEGVEGIRQSSLHCVCASQPFLHLARPGEEEDKENISHHSPSAVETSVAGEAARRYCLVHRKESVVVI